MSKDQEIPHLKTHTFSLMLGSHGSAIAVVVYFLSVENSISDKPTVSERQIQPKSPSMLFDTFIPCTASGGQRPLIPFQASAGRSLNYLPLMSGKSNLHQDHSFTRAKVVTLAWFSDS